MKKINAKNVIKTLKWIAEMDQNSPSKIEPFLNEDGIYECIVFLPLIDKTIIGIGDSKLESIENVANKSTKLIDQFIKDNPQCLSIELNDDSKYFLEEDDNGYLCMHYVQKEAYC